MNKYKELLQGDNLKYFQKHPFFTGMSDGEAKRFILHAEPDLIELEPDQHYVIEAGANRRLGVVISGSVRVFTVDYSGNKTVLNTLQNYGSIGTMQFMVEHYNMLFEIIADTPSLILMFDPLTMTVAKDDIVHIQHKILVNLMSNQRQLFITISEHLVCLSQKNLRDKVLRYLQIHSDNARSYSFDIPLSREDLAAYLAVDRASLSRTLGALKREGAIDFHKNHFTILDIKFFKF